MTAHTFYVFQKISTKQNIKDMKRYSKKIPSQKKDIVKIYSLCLFKVYQKLNY